jgi:hypothetical protein|nr:MAG TPA: hypothetical protein [Caudoviricetes sp.]
MKKIMKWLGKVPAEKWMRMLIIMVVTMLCVAGFHIAGWDGLPCVVFGWMLSFFLYIGSQIAEDKVKGEIDNTNFPYDAVASVVSALVLTVLMT